jgi:hypothetical protein
VGGGGGGGGGRGGGGGGGARPPPPPPPPPPRPPPPPPPPPLLVAAFFLAACGVRAPITHRVTLDFDKDAKRVTVTAVTDLSSDPTGKAIVERVNAAREVYLGSRDEWSARFANVDAESERQLFVKRRGVLERVEHSAVIDRDSLQRFFGDLPMTIAVTRADGWSELTIYPGASVRASKPQRDHLQKSMQSWTAAAAKYLQAMDRLYSYLNERPDRAEAVFIVMLSSETRAVNGEEQALINDVSDAQEAIEAKMRPSDTEAITLDEEADLVFNPFPAEIVVHLPKEPTAIENFEKRSADTVAIHRLGLLDAVKALEGRWVSPDPLALALKADADADLPAPSWFASQTRRSSPLVTASEIEKAVTEKLRPAASYKVRWID